MGFLDNKYVAKFIAGGAAPPLPPTHPSEAVSSAPEQYNSRPISSGPILPPGWVQQWDPNTQQVYYLEQATGLTQWVPPMSIHVPDSSAASIRSSTTAHTTTPLIGRSDQSSGLKQHDVVRRNHVYLNLPTATEREEMRKKAEEKRAKEGDKPYVLKRYHSEFELICEQAAELWTEVTEIPGSGGRVWHAWWRWFLILGCNGRNSDSEFAFVIQPSLDK
jgi:hypothetical protein